MITIDFESLRYDQLNEFTQYFKDKKWNQVAPVSDPRNLIEYKKRPDGFEGHVFYFSPISYVLAFKSPMFFNWLTYAAIWCIDVESLNFAVERSFALEFLTFDEPLFLDEGDQKKFGLPAKTTLLEVVKKVCILHEGDFAVVSAYFALILLGNIPMDI